MALRCSYSSHETGGRLYDAMKRLTPLILAIAVILGVTSTTPSAQTSDTRVVFINSQAAIAAHPLGTEVSRIEEQARAETSEIAQSIEQLAARARAGEELTPEEQERYQTLVTTLQTVQQRYEQQFNEAAGPVIEAVNQAIAQVAAQNGYDIVLDSVAAGPQGTNLVVYAVDGLDITDQVIATFGAE